ncbi:MAG TPA: PRC-barrel domain-containing protein [Hyphomicrobiaceae bacterium]
MRRLVRIALGALALAAMAAMEASLANAHAQAVAQASAADESARKDSAPKDSTTQDAVPKDGGAKATDESAQKSRLVSILGREVTNRDGDSGRVIDVLVDLDGRSGAVVVEFGGFMGIGSRKVAVDWNALRFVREGNRSLLTVDVSRNQIRDAPEYKPNEQPTVLTTK